jgi:hypothetical protein
MESIELGKVYRQMRCGMDRARRVISETIIGFVGINSWTNRDGFPMNFHIFSMFFCSTLHCSKRWEYSLEKATPEIDSARGVLLGPQASLVGTNSTANLFRLYLNPNLRYPTLVIIGFKMSNSRKVFAVSIVLYKNIILS